ncbi:hypothetical protein D3C71_1229690 [compost metagenome]
MIFKAVGRIICRADDLNTGLLNELPRAEASAGESLVRPLPDGRSVLGVQNVRNSEVAPQLQMGPMIERIANCRGQRPSKCQELLVIFPVSGYIPLLYSVRAHDSPFIMIAIEPDLSQIAVRLVLINLLGV